MKAAKTAFFLAGCALCLLVAGVVWNPVGDSQTQAHIRPAALGPLLESVALNDLSASPSLDVTNCKEMIENQIPALQARLETSAQAYEQLLEAAHLSLVFIDNNLAQMALDREALTGLPEQLSSAEEGFINARRAYAANLDGLLGFGSVCQTDEAAFLAAVGETALERQRLEAAAAAIIRLIESDFTTAFEHIERQLIEVPNQTL